MLNIFCPTFFCYQVIFSHSFASVLLNRHFRPIKMKGKNIFVNYLNLLGVRHTDSFSDRYFNEHPHKYNLYGLSKMLSDYGINHAATHIPDKANDITEIQTPFIAQFSGDFVAVHKVESGNVSFLWKGANHILPVARFIEAWTGIVLMAEAFETSIEPNYRKHRKENWIDLLKKVAFFASCGLIAVMAYLNNNGILPLSIVPNQILYNNAGISLLLIVNFAGIYVSWLLLLKQMHVESRYADRICSLFKQKDCNSILESEAAKLFGIIGWSEIGFGYFLTNVLILLFAPAWIINIALINILTLPYAFWSVWYQKTKAGQWCMLCLIVQVLLWAVFIINLFSGYIRLSTLHAIVDAGSLVIAGFDPQSLLGMLFVGSCYIVLILGINLLVPKLNTGREIQSLRQSINSMKADESVFVTLLRQQPHYETNDCQSIIRFGNPNGKLQVTVLSNPYCNPCASMHKRIEELLKENSNISVQYILSSFSEDLNSTGKYLIAAFLNPSTGGAGEALLSDWFEKGKSLKNDYFKGFSFDMENPAIEVELRKHEDWKQKTQLRATPTILVNGYQLPESYRIEDLRYFTDLDL